MHNIISSQQPYGSSKRIQLINPMSPMESLLNAIDGAHPMQTTNNDRKRSRSPQQAAMSIESILDNDNDHYPPSKRPHHEVAIATPPPQSPPFYHQQPQPQLTTVTCYHASVAQKSYGAEKRFLCPPPIVMMDNSQQQQSPIVSMSVVCETGDRQLEQRTLLDSNAKGSFKYLFVTGTAKAKQFCLRVNLHNQQEQQQQQHHSYQHQPYASFFSRPISIISKPSKKTAKARNISTCLFTNSYVSLFNRINSQTVRTKYLTSENKQLCVKHSSWSPFEIIVVRQPNQANNPDNHSVSVPITYGTEIVLKDVHSGVSSPPLIIRKVDKGHIVHGAYGLLSQMQKIALQLSSTANNNNNKPLYLNANGAAMSLPEADNTNANHNISAWIDFVSSKPSTSFQADERAEAVDDYLCWTIVGISKFEETFAETPIPTTTLSSNAATTTTSAATAAATAMTPPHLYPIDCSARQPSPPPSPPRSIVPFPVITSMEYLPQTHSLKAFGQSLTTGSSAHSRPLEFWLGSHGPLSVTHHNNSLTIAVPDTQELLAAHQDLLVSKADGSRYFELPLVLVRHDGCAYPSGKTLCYTTTITTTQSGTWSVHDNNTTFP